MISVSEPFICFCSDFHVNQVQEGGSGFRTFCSAPRTFSGPIVARPAPRHAVPLSSLPGPCWPARLRTPQKEKQALSSSRGRFPVSSVPDPHRGSRPPPQTSWLPCLCIPLFPCHACFRSFLHVWLFRFLFEYFYCRAALTVLKG